MTQDRYGLTPDQAEVLDAICEGSSTDKEIARWLGKQPKTVAFHIERAMRRIGVTSRVQAALAWERQKSGRTA